MNYMSPSLGGDEGVKLYFSSLVRFGSGDLYVHPEVAHRLKRVEAELKDQGLPMPQTTTGFALRGDHLLSKRERNTPGMLAHAMGLAVDYYAYKNVHLEDDRRLRELLHTVAGRPPHMQLPPGALRMIVQSGKAKMGEGTIDQQAWGEVERAIGNEFDALAQASDAFEESLGPERKAEVIRHHGALMAARADLERLKKAARKASKRTKQDAEAAVSQAESQLSKAESELRSQLPWLFGPWLDQIDKRIQGLLEDAQEQGVDLEQVTSAPGLRGAKGEEQRMLKARNDQIQAKVGTPNFKQLQEDKITLFWLRRTSESLQTDLDFMFKSPAVSDPGAAQLLGGLESKYGGGGHLGPTDRSVGTTKGDRFYAESGFNRVFFQVMASYGFWIGAAWKTSDAMHFQLEELVDQIVPPDSAKKAPMSAGAKGKASVGTVPVARNPLGRGESSNRGSPQELADALRILKEAELDSPNGSTNFALAAAISTVEKSGKYEVDRNNFQVSFRQPPKGKRIDVSTIEDFILFVEFVERTYPNSTPNEIASELRQLWFSDPHWSLLVASQGISTPDVVHNPKGDLGVSRAVDLESREGPAARLFNLERLAPRNYGKVLRTRLVV